jgi:S1-C subfamily serine protease
MVREISVAGYVGPADAGEITFKTTTQETVTVPREEGKSFGIGLIGLAAGVVKVASLRPNSAAVTAGLRLGDVLITINGEGIRTESAANKHLLGIKAGNVATIVVQRES